MLRRTAKRASSAAALVHRDSGVCNKALPQVSTGAKLSGAERFTPLLMQRPRSAEQRWRARVQLIGSGTVAYAVLSILSNAKLTQGNDFAVLWLPEGLLAAVALRSGVIAVPIALLGTLLAAWCQGGDPSGTVLTLGLAETAAMAVVALVAPRWMGRGDLLSTGRSLTGFVSAVTVASLLNTLIAAAALPSLRDWTLDGGALSWWLSNIGGTVALAPVLLYWIGRRSEPRLRELCKPEFVLLLLASLGAALLVNSGGIKLLTIRPSALLLPLMLWGSFRFSPPAACLIFAIQAVVLTLAPNRTVDLLVLNNGIEANEVQQLLVIVVGLTSLITLMTSVDRSRTSRQLQQLTGSLERTVAERTAQLAAANAELHRLSSTDGLTGLTNRRQFDVLLNARWREAALNGSSVAIAMIDIDHFKAYNDHYGHQAGDLCLQQVAAALSDVMRGDRDCLARYGGEEFIVLWNRVSREQAAELAERLRQAVQALHLPHAANPCGAQVSLSIGVAVTRVPETARSAPNTEVEAAIEALIQRADQRLYAAKSAGRNRVVAA